MFVRMIISPRLLDATSSFCIVVKRIPPDVSQLMPLGSSLFIVVLSNSGSPSHGMLVLCALLSLDLFAMPGGAPSG